MNARHLRTAGFLCLSLLCALPAAAQAPAVSGIFSMRLQNSANSANLATGDIMFWGANDVIPAATTWGFTRQCPIGADCSSGPSDPDFVRQALFYRPFEVRPNQFFASRPHDVNLTEAWRLLLSSDPAFPNDPSKSTFVNTPAIGTVGLMPFVQSMTVSGTGLTPTISWTLPTSMPGGLTVDRSRIFLFDRSNPVTVTSRSPTLSRTFQQDDLIFISEGLPAAQTSFTLPSSWTTPNGNRSLQFGSSYSVAVVLEHLRPGANPASAGAADSRSQSFFDYTPINLPGVQDIHLPTAVPVPTTSGLVSGPLYEFHVASVSPTSVTFIDPFVATGFTFATGAGDPNFKSVQIATQAGDGLYDVFRFDGTNWLLAKANLATGQTYDFVDEGGLGGGVSTFQVRGIEESAGLSPFDMTAFVTGLTFVAPGSFTGTMQAITVEVPAVPEPSSLVMMLAGLGVAGAVARRRRGPLAA